MKGFKTVTLCASDRGRKDELVNAFIANRKSSCQYQLPPKQYCNPRCKSAPFYSEFRPVTYSELRENFPKILQMKYSVLEDAKDSMVSARTKHEINSAVLLTEKRTQQEYTNIRKDHIADENLDTVFIYKVHSCNHLSKSAKRSIENRIYRNNNRWKSASTDFRRPERKPSSIVKELHKPPKIVPLKNNSKDRESLSSPCVREEEQKDHSDTSDLFKDEPPIISSIANSLTNVLTIDDIYGAKIDWERNKFSGAELVKGSEENLPEKQESTYRSKSLPSQRKRETVLRDYMNVYLNWRISNSIQEHRDLFCGRIRNSRIKTAGPKTRLQQFQKILEQKQALLPKKTTLKDKDRNQLTLTFADKETHTPRAHYRSPSPFKNVSNNLFGNQESSDTDNKLKFIGTNEESSDDDHADSYSDIDWLQCEDI